MKKGAVYLVGAGCGDPELITWKGLKLLKACDVVLYDDLSAEKLLEETKADCEQIYVGKRYGNHSASQTEINTLLITKAKAGHAVVRLKGGDPFVFGRGGEEILALQAEGIPYEVISGVTSSIAVPAAAGIPVTHRKTARSFHVITGHTAADGKETLSERLEILAELEGTLVFLMGLHHLEEITQGLLRYGKAPETPAAVISKGTTPEQRMVRSTLGKLAEAVRAEALEAPAVIVIGETAGMDLCATVTYPLKGVKIGVTGTKSITRKLRDRLEELGAAVTEFDYSRIVPYTENRALDEALEQIQNYRWAVFTSPNGVQIFFDYLCRKKQDIRMLAGVRFAAIGTGTAVALEQRGIFASYLPEIYDVEHLARGLCETVKKDEGILILRAEQGSEILTEIFDAEGMIYSDIKIYDILVDEEKRKYAQKKATELDFLTFASGSGVRGFLQAGGSIPVDVKTVCIGEATAKILEKNGYQKQVVAKKYNVNGVIEAILQEVEKR